MHSPAPEPRTFVQTKPLSSPQVEELLELVEAWLATEPPSVYYRVGGHGREDGHAEKLTVRMGGRTYSTGISSDREALSGDPHRAPPEWYALITALIQGPPDASFEPAALDILQ